MKRKILIFLLSIIIFWTDWIIIGQTWNNFHDNIYTIVNLALLPIFITMLLAGIILITKIVSRLKGKGGVYKTKEFLGAIFTILLISVILLLHFNEYNIAMNKNHNISGFGPIVSKTINDGNYYFYLGREDRNIRFQCDKKTYNTLLINDKVLYTFEYRMDFFNENRGIIKSLDLENYIDNRIKLNDS
ncbi:MAG: hypothetical protein FD141_735 [Fusobacteria bacterium]|nr:MAG: hypothetical protein FD141_735 [Fusobacteriota bacterium]KAF0228599.1 MAG: hypothetical protein FD182_855 [Fusobacteriota bacterium]